MAISRGRLMPSLLFLLSAVVSHVAADALDFSLYPTKAQSCLYAAADSSKCDTSTVSKFNACVCGNGGGFLQLAASCLGSSDSSDVTGVYNTMNTNCKDSNTPIAFTAAKWASVADAGTSKTTSSKKTTSTTSTARPTTSVKTVTAPTGTTKLITVTAQPSAGQTSGATSLVTLTPGQTTVVNVEPTGTDSAAAQSTTGSASLEEKSSIGTGVIAGAAVGGAVILILAGLALFFFLRYRKQKKNAQYEPAPFIGGGGGSTEYKPQRQSYSNLPPSHSTGAEKYAAAPPYAHGEAQHYDEQGYSAYKPYGGGYAQVPNNGSNVNLAHMPPPQNGAVELQGLPSVPNYRHELPS
ncbi:hypothetical protein EJ08DRAFT_665586 [Tothia fuscella]|uniref:Uncharacterized protein n=1 Tax=Tothia fuscella TaxID=1048955 RepID=A0A9P4TTI2_9PEZI|nr:hypothetical protein EJ08DRAFT_665586 [Tothia fuscella]